MDLQPELSKHAPGFIGSLTALLFIRPSSCWRAAGLLLAGAASSMYGGPYVVIWLSADPGLAGWLVGLFGMATVAKVYEVLEAVRPKTVIDRILDRALAAGYSVAVRRAAAGAAVPAAAIV